MAFVRFMDVTAFERKGPMVYDYRSTDNGCYIKVGTERIESVKTDARVAFLAIYSFSYQKTLRIMMS